MIGDEAFWVRGCLSRALGIVDSAVTILELLPFATDNIEEGYAPIAAMSKATYSYENMMSLLHDLLDNIGYMYMEKVWKNKKVKTPSFLKLFESQKLSELSNDAELNETMQSLYKNTCIYANKDNKYKHSFSSGLVDLNQPGEFIRKNGKKSGNIGYFLDNGAVSTDKASIDAKEIKDEILYLALTCVVQLIYYERKGLF